jgi:hypothetical protein
MTKTNATVQGTIRGGEDYATAYGDDIYVEIPADEFNDYVGAGEGQVRWQTRRVGGQQFFDALANKYKLLVAQGSVFSILKIEFVQPNKLLLTVEASDQGSSAGFL